MTERASGLRPDDGAHVACVARGERVDERARLARRAAWLGTLHQWHWISSALCLVGMLLFAVTGITLNHAADIGATPVVTHRELTLPDTLRSVLAASPAPLRPGADPDRATGRTRRSGDAAAPLPAPVRDWLAGRLGVGLDAVDAEWSADEVHLALPRPGGDAWLRIERASGDVEYEHTDRGWVSYLNDLHKGRHTGAAWRWFIDAFSLACVLFCVTGLLILKFHAANRPGTWPIVGLGLVIPLLLAILLVH
jgi:hypothetical protein